MVISLSDYKFKLEDANEPDGFAYYKGRMEVSYDGEFLGIDSWEVPVDDELPETGPIQSFTLVGPDQANLLVGAILALLESYGEPCYLNDEDIQKEYKQMAEATKNSYAQEAATELQDWFGSDWVSCVWIK